MSTLRRLSSNDLPRLRQFWVEHWGGDEMITRGNVYRPEQLEGFLIEEEGEWIDSSLSLSKMASVKSHRWTACARDWELAQN